MIEYFVKFYSNILIALLLDIYLQNTKSSSGSSGRKKNWDACNYLGLPLSIKIQVVFRVLHSSNRHVLGPHVRHFAVVGFQINKGTSQSNKHKDNCEYGCVY